MDKARRKTSDVKLLGIILYCLLYVLCTVVAVVSTAPQQYDLEVGTISDKTITAPQDIVDEYSTELLRQEEMQKVKPVYIVDNDVPLETEERIQEAFAQAEAVRVAAKQFYLSRQTTSVSASDFDPAQISWDTELSTSEINRLLAMLPEYVTEQNIYTISAMEQNRLTALRDSVLENVNMHYQNEGILADDLASIASEIRSSLVTGGAFSNIQADLAYNIIIGNLQSNMTFDAEATETEKQAAADNVTPVEYKRGQNIVQKGEKILQRHVELIKALGLTNGQDIMMPRWIVGALVMLMLFGTGMFYILVADRSLVTSVKNAFSVFLLTLLIVLIAVICKQIHSLLHPVFLASILCAAFLRRRTAIAYGGFVTILVACVQAPSNAFFFSQTLVPLLFSGALGSTAAILLMRKKQHRGEYVLAGLLAGCINAVVNIAYGVIQEYVLSDYLLAVGFGVANGLLFGLISVGLLPVWEAMFSLATPSKLLELANPGNELLKRLMIEAPGTYHHSVMTANLAEAGCEAVGGDALLARVAAYYHDIGKLANPHMFKENQMHMKNPHDDLPPRESADIIISHVKNGTILADKYKLPKKVRDIIREHHGDSLATYFYYMAKQQGEAYEEDFRYPGPKPQTKEAGVVMLADVVEAAVRANASLVKGNLQEQIAKLIKAKYDDGQLDNCPLNRRDLQRISEAFIYVFEGANHERIVYPEEDEK